jgi:hypothetical protein
MRRVTYFVFQAGMLTPGCGAGLKGQVTAWSVLRVRRFPFLHGAVSVVGRYVNIGANQSYMP